MVAFLWDYMLILGYLLVLFGLSYIAQSFWLSLFTKNAWLSQLSGFLLITLPVYVYFAISEGSKAHASWGKRRMKLIVARSDGQVMGYGTSFKRSALKFIPWELGHFTVWHMTMPSPIPDFVVYTLLIIVYGLVFLYLLSPLWSKERQTFYDKLAGTIVRDPVT